MSFVYLFFVQKYSITAFFAGLHNHNNIKLPCLQLI